MDDLDDLLDEVERDLHKTDISKAENVGYGNHQRHSRTNRKKAKVRSDEIDDVIDSILDQGDDIHDGKPHNAKEIPAKVDRQENLSNSSGGKCYPMLLGGTKNVKGKSTFTAKKACNNIRCTSCDFKVLMFDGCKWRDCADYLFFRNNMPDRLKLQPNLREDPGSVAYCCQCSWKSAKDLTPVAQFKDLKWVCAKHN